MQDELTEQERERLAVEVMRVDIRKANKHPSNPSFYYVNDRLLCMDSDWKPDQNYEQAFKVLDKFDAWNIRKEEMILEPYSVDVFYDDKWSYKDGEVLTLTICRAVLAAMGEL